MVSPSVFASMLQELRQNPLDFLYTDTENDDLAARRFLEPGAFDAGCKNHHLKNRMTR
jgi:hypothetical protein